MKVLIFLFLLISTSQSFAAAYIGGSYGLTTFTSDALDEYNVTPKGSTYGGFLGIGRDFVGIEGFYQTLSTTGKVKHDGEKYDITENATALGAALRFSFELFYLRLGVAQYKLDQSLEIDDETILRAAEEVYDIQTGSKNGLLFGVGFHKKVKSARVFIDYSRYQITGVGAYDSISAGIAFAIPDRFFNAGRN